jgi:hypothetical protein
MSPSEPTADDLIADWLSPRQAVEILDAAYPPASRVSKQVLLERLRGGMVQAVAAHSVFDGGRQGREVFYKIPSDDWERVDTSDILWITGELTYTRREHGLAGRTTVRHYNVRFEPQGVRAIVANAPKEPAAKPDPDKPEPAQKGPRVTDPHLEAWFDLFTKVYSGTVEDTEDRALESARGMFPGKSVTRDRIRALRGNRPMGRPKKQGS